MINGKKDMLAKLLFGSTSLFERLARRSSSDRLLVLAYHRIGALPDESYPFQHEIMSATPDEFDRQLEFLNRHFNVTNFHTLAGLDDAGESYPPNSAVITFDDGYLDNFSTALPVLEARDLTATVYVSTGFIDAQQPFWFDMLSFYVMRMAPGFLSINRGNFRIEVTEDNRRQIRSELGRAVRAVSDETRLMILDELKEQSGVSPTAEEVDLARPMSWDQVRALNAAGVEIGSHTVSHPFLVQLQDDELHRELAESKTRIEQETGATVSSLSYPTGGSEYFDSRSVKTARQCGYRFAVSYDHATTSVADMNPFAIPRIHVEPDVHLPLFKANMLLPRVFVR